MFGVPGEDCPLRGANYMIATFIILLALLPPSYILWLRDVIQHLKLEKLWFILCASVVQFEKKERKRGVRSWTALNLSFKPPPTEYKVWTHSHRSYFWKTLMRRICCSLKSRNTNGKCSRFKWPRCKWFMRIYTVYLELLSGFFWLLMFQMFVSLSKDLKPLEGSLNVKLGVCFECIRHPDWTWSLDAPCIIEDAG